VEKTVAPTASRTRTPAAAARESEPVPAGMTAAEWNMRCDLAALYRVVAYYGWGDLLSTHISARIPDDRSKFLINPWGLLFEEVTATNLIKVDEHGNVLDKTEYKINPAGYLIHSCVHVGRPEIDCVLHLHTRDGTAVATQRAGLLPLTQHALVIYDHIAYHDFEGLVLEPTEQKTLLADLGDKRMLILRNHGTLTAGRTVGEAFTLMYRLERACRMQVAAQKTGQPLTELPQSVIQEGMAGGERIFGAKGPMPGGQAEWAAMLRKLALLGIEYRH
jgi:ribulose-5-phosphate 4-epimerase/fuculose-1-phosphate aldolase